MKVHLCLDITGFLMNNTRKEDYRGMFKHDDGRLMSTDEAKRELLRQLSLGRKVLPLGDCDNFDFQEGCLGHADESPASFRPADIPKNGETTETDGTQQQAPPKPVK